MFWRDIFTGSDNKWSLRRVSSGVVLCGVVINGFAIKVLSYLLALRRIEPTDKSIDAANILMDLQWSLIAFCLLLLGIITSQDIINLRTRSRFPGENPEQPTSGSSEP